MYDELKSIALDLTWTWDHRIAGVFPALDAEVWERTGHNPIALVDELGPEGCEEAAERPEVRTAIDAARAARREYAERPSQVASSPGFVGYFSLEFALTDALPIYSGGLGVLAGDHLKASSDLGLPLVGVGLLYRKGFGHQRIDEAGDQREEFTTADFDHMPVQRALDGDGAPLEVECPLGASSLRLAVWRAQVGRTPLLLLDSDIDANPPELRTVTDQLYAPEPERRLPQEIALGVGGMRALRALGIRATALHMNEGHGFLVAVERVRELRTELGLGLDEAERLARAQLVFTTHTPVAAGSDYFSPELVAQLLGGYLDEVGYPLERFCDLGRREPGNAAEYVCTTFVGLRSAGCSVGVSRLHGEVSRRLWRDAFPGPPAAGDVPIGAVTNGVHLPSWVAPEIGALLARHVTPAWADLDADDDAWERVRDIPDDELWACHRALRRRLVERVAGGAVGGPLDPDVLTIGFSRRFAPYKRANLVLSDGARLARLMDDRDRPVQLVFSGKAHPADMQGKAIVHDIVEAARHRPRFAFVPDYGLEVAGPLVQGADVWLNNPRRFLEASGTSGMKAGANGVLNLSVLDGWWDEGFREGIGWVIPSAATMDGVEPDDAAEGEALYRILEHEVIPSFYERDERGIPIRWVAMMRASIRHIAAQFSARRMVLQYHHDCYLPAMEEARHLVARPRTPA